MYYVPCSSRFHVLCFHVGYFMQGRGHLMFRCFHIGISLCRNVWLHIFLQGTRFMCAFWLLRLMIHGGGACDRTDNSCRLHKIFILINFVADVLIHRVRFNLRPKSPLSYAVSVSSSVQHIDV